MLDANGNYVYPWNHGETLTAASLNAAIAQSSGAAVSAAPPTDPAIGAIWYNPATGSISVWDGAVWQPVAGAGGPFLPLSGGTVTGPTTFASSLTLSGSLIWAGQTATGFGTGIGQVPLFTSRASVPTWETSNQFMINRAANVAANGADLWIRHAGAVSGGALTNVNKGLMVDYSVPATDANNNWATLSKITQASTSGGQAVAAYAQAWKTSGTGLTTALISEASDQSGNKSSLSGQLTSQEMDLGGTDVDDGANAQRFGGVGVRQLVHAVFSQPSTTVNSEYTMGIWFGTQTNGSAASYVDSLLGVQGNTTPTMIRNFLDSRGAIAPTGVTDPVAVVRASAGHIIDFNGGPSLTSAPGNYLQYTTTGGNRLRYMAGTSEWLSITDGGSITANGPLNYTATGGITSRSAQDRAADVKNVSDFGTALNDVTIQAAINALPATGGTVMLAPNTTYNITALITTATPGVRVTAPGWGTILRRDPAYSSAGLLLLSGANSVVEGFTIDGNGVLGTQFELSVSGASSVVRNMQIINGGGTGHLNLSSQNGRATGNTITGLGTSPSTQRGYGIWAINHNTVTIDNNTISGTGIDAIGFDGTGSIVMGNHVSNCHCWTGGPGGQVASYYTPLGGVGTSSSIINNYIGAPGSIQGSGIESWVPGAVVSGNTIENLPGAAITVFGNGTTIAGNSIRNCGGTADALVVTANVTDFVIVGNRISDDQATPTMRYAIAVYAGTSNRYVISGNQCTPNTSQAIFDAGTGTSKTIVSNLGAPNTLTAATSISGGALSVGNSTTTQPFNINGPAGSGRALHFQTAGLDRWTISGSTVAEGGSNTGTLLNVSRYDDTGTFLDVPIGINRASGVVSFAQGGNGIAIGTPTLRSGTGAATGTQPKGSLWLRTDGAAGTTLYVSQGAGTWNAVSGV